MARNRYKDLDDEEVMDEVQTSGQTVGSQQDTTQQPVMTVHAMTMEEQEAGQMVVNLLHAVNEAKDGVKTVVGEFGKINDDFAKNVTAAQQLCTAIDTKVASLNDTPISVDISDSAKKTMDGYKDQMVESHKACIAEWKKEGEEFGVRLTNATNSAVGEFGKAVQSVTDKHIREAETRLDKISEKKMGKGHWCSTPVWVIKELLLWTSVIYALYSAWDVCLWGELWNRVWLPVCAMGLIIAMLCLLLGVTWWDSRRYSIK